MPVCPPRMEIGNCASSFPQRSLQVWVLFPLFSFSMFFFFVVEKGNSPSLLVLFLSFFFLCRSSLKPLLIFRCCEKSLEEDDPSFFPLTFLFLAPPWYGVSWSNAVSLVWFFRPEGSLFFLSLLFIVATGDPPPLIFLTRARIARCTHFQERVCAVSKAESPFGFFIDIRSLCLPSRL